MRPKAIKQHIRQLLSSKAASELTVYGFFVLLSAGAWLMQVLHDNYEYEAMVPIVLADVPADVVITDSIPREIAVKVRDRGTTLMMFFLDNGKQPMALSFRDYDTTHPIGTVRISNSDIIKHLQAYLPPSTGIQHVVGDSLQFSYNRGVMRRLPVRVTGSFKSKQHTYVQNMRLMPDSVTVYARSEVLDTMTMAQTIPISIDNMGADTHVVLHLTRARGLRCVPDTVGVDIHIDSYTEKTVEVPITGINFPAGRSLRTFPSKVKVTFRVGMANYNNVTADDFVLAVSYEELMRTGRCLLRFKSLPQGVSNARLSQSAVDYLIEQEGD